MKSTEEHQAQQLLDKAGDYCNKGESSSLIGAEPIALIRAVVGCGLSMLAVAEELRETRGQFVQIVRNPTEPVIVKSCEHVFTEKTPEPEPLLVSSNDRTARGHLAIAFLAMAGTIVLLLVLCVVLALT